MKYNETLQNINWFANTGVQVDESLFELPVQNAKDLNECIKNIGSLKWENFVLYARNRLSGYVQRFHKEEYKKWNEIARGAREGFDSFNPLIQQYAHSKNLPEAVVQDIKSVMISFFIEQSYSEMLDNAVPQQFNKILKIYEAGKTACGWTGKLPKNEGYEAVNFNEGKILVW